MKYWKKFAEVENELPMSGGGGLLVSCNSALNYFNIFLFP